MLVARAQPRPPGRHGPVGRCYNGLEREVLRYEPPVGVARIHEDYAYGASRANGHERGYHALFHHEVAEQIGRLYHAETRYYESQERHTCQQRELGRAVERRNGGRGKEKDNVQKYAHADGEPENGVVVGVRDVLLYADGRGKAAFLQVPRQEGEHREHGYYAVVARRKAARKAYSYYEGEQLLHPARQPAPEKSPGGAFFE